MCEEVSVWEPGLAVGGEKMNDSGIKAGIQAFPTDRAGVTEFVSLWQTGYPQDAVHNDDNEDDDRDDGDLGQHADR